MQNEKHINALRVVLDYVERWNKKDEDSEVAEAAQILTDYLNTFE